jgi:hypothetical protein
MQVPTQGLDDIRIVIALLGNLRYYMVTGDLAAMH